MFHDINHLLTTAYELEGLLTLARDRGDETPRRVYDQIKTKISILNAAITPDEAAEPTDAPKVAPMPEEKVNPEEKAEEMTSQAERQEEVRKEIETPEPEKSPAADSETTAAEEDAEAAETEEWEDSEPNPEDGPEDLNRLDMQQAEEDEADSEASEADEWENHHSAEIDEMKSDGAELRKYFTLNDRFRYRRELFGGSDVAYKAGIALIASMKSIDEVKRYLTSDLGLAPDSQEVADFIELVTPYFQSKK